MKKDMSIILKVFCLVMVLCFVLYNEKLIFVGKYLSKVHLLFIVLMALITSCKYNILKNNIESSKKHKFFNCIVVIFSVFIIINFVYMVFPKHLEINNWLTTEYNDNFKQEVLDFMFLPKYFDTLNILKMTTIEAIFSVLVVGLAYLREWYGQREKSYILEKILKHVFIYNLLIIFIIYALTIHNKFLLVRTVKHAGIIILFLSVIYVFIKSYLELKSYKDRNKEKIEKENLIIVMTSGNYKFNLYDWLINPLRIFYRYDNKNLIKSLLVEGKKYCFVSYDAIRYNLIDINQYKNISYLIIVCEYDLQDIDKKSNFIKKVDEIVKDNYNFVISDKKTFVFQSNTLKELKEKYTFRVKENLDLKSILDMTSLTQNADTLKKNSKKLLEYIENKEKVQISGERNVYLKYGLKLILDSFSYTEYFYTMLKMCEYVIHYIGLKTILDEEIKTKEQKDAIRLSTWRIFIKYDKTYTLENKEKKLGIASDEDICNSIINLKNILNDYNNKKVINDTSKKEFTFRKDICQIVADIRNKIVAHGIVSVEIAQKISKDLFNILFALVKEFEELNITINQDEKIKNIFKKDIAAVYRYSNKMFLYSNPVLKDKEVIYNECINYETGNKKVIDNKVKLFMNRIFTVEEIKKALGRWVIEDEAENNKD